MRHVAYSTNDDGENLAMAISATTPEDTWFSGQKSRLRLGGDDNSGIYTSSASTIVDIIAADADAVVDGDYATSTHTQAVHLSGQFRVTNAEDEDDEGCVQHEDGTDNNYADKQVICDREADGEYYGHLRLLSAISAATVVPSRSATSASDKWPFRRKKSRNFFKRKRWPSLSNVVEIYEHSSTAAAPVPAPTAAPGHKVLFSDFGGKRRSEVAQNSKTRSVFHGGGDSDGGGDSASSAPRASLTSVHGDDVTTTDDGGGDENGEFAVDDDVTSLISVSKAACVECSPAAAVSLNKRLLGSACDLCDDKVGGADSSSGGAGARVRIIKNRSGSLSKSWYGEGAYLERVIFPDDGVATNNGDGLAGRRNRRRTFSCLPEDKDGIGEIGVDLEERVVLLQRSASVPDDDALSTPPARKTSTTSVDGVNTNGARNSIPQITVTAAHPKAAPPTASTAATMSSSSSGSKLSKWSKSKIDLLVPSLKSLVTMTTNKLSASRPANLNYWRNSTSNCCNGVNNYCSSSRFDVRPFGSPFATAATTLRRNVSLNNVTHKHAAADHLKNASSDDFAEMCLLKKLRKCNTAVTLSSCVTRNPNVTPAATVGATLRVEPLKPVNRLRVCAASQDALLAPSKMCSRCSSLLSMASSSRYSLNSTYGFVPVSAPSVLCKVCLNEVPLKDSWTLQHCECSYCVDCVRSYVEFEINQGAYSISCPDAQCEKQGIILLEEIESLVSLECIEKHKRYRLNKEVEMDKSRTWCPQAGCETVCTLCSTDRCMPQSVHCPTCSMDFCSNCRGAWHAGSACKSEEVVPGVTFDSELIKCCPMCSVPIEKDEGCAQMLCKRCKHVFCWYCLASLDDDFLLRHYDKGPCKNKLGHSRASVIWHRTQVISIFAGFGILLLIASPLLLLAAPCIVCCKCRVCTSDSRLDADDDIPGEAPELQLNAEITTTDQDQDAGDAWKV